jgi:RimJ/RimL family protein N-acetyltransferase
MNSEMSESMTRKIRLQGTRIALRSYEDSDLETFWHYMFDDSEPEFKKWDAPYFPLVYCTLEEYIEANRKRIASEAGGVQSRLVIEAEGKAIGMVSYYWEHQESNWLEMGIVIFPPAYWSNGYGTEALKMWGDYLFHAMPLVRVGLTTWSGNERMIKCAEKLGMLMEARLRKCRLWQGTYYDSIRMGVLREEWEAIHRPQPIA